MSKTGAFPDTWCNAKISEITFVNPTLDKAGIADDLEVSFVPMPAVQAESGVIDVSGIRKFSEVKKGYTPFREGDVLFAKITPCMENGKMAVVPEVRNGIGFGSTEFHVLRAQSGVDAKYVYYYVSSQPFRRVAEHNMSGAVGQRRVTTPYLSDCEVPLPPSIEQHRIVAKIEELFSDLDKGIENLKTARAQLKVYRQALLKHAFEGKLTAQWRKENKHKLETADALQKRIQQERAQRYQQQLADWEATGKQGSKPKAPKPLPPLTAEELAELPELPEGWGWCKWEDILVSEKGAFKRGPFGSALKKEFFVKSGYKVYEQYCPINDDCSFERYYISDEKFRELEGFSVRAEDFLVSCSGVTLGRITQVPLNFKEGIINQALLRVRVNSAVYDFQFFKTFFRSRYFQKRIFENSTGTAIPNVKGVNELKSIPLPLCSLLEQQQIVLELEARLSEVDQLDQTITTALQQAEALRQSILKKAFSGQLVAQDANDEPASMLLAHIKAKRTVQAATAKPRKPQKARGWPAPAKTNVIPFPVKISNISATDLHAGILARAYRLHEKNSKHLAYFGHVKAEKIAHLVEAHLGIDLEREPIKDAAGPNDYPHLKKVESRARKANWFDVLQQNKDGAYVFSKKHGFDALLDRTATALGKRVADVDALLKLLLPLNTRQAEIVATLYAAWNNLLLLGHSPEDEEIVCEARENWHESKLQIDREKFFKGLEWMRKQGLVPAGRGRYVAEKSKQPKSGEVIHD